MNKNAKASSSNCARLHIPPNSIVLQRSVMLYRNLKGAIFPERASESGLTNAAETIRDAIIDFCAKYGSNGEFITAKEYRESVAQLLRMELTQETRKEEDTGLFYTLQHLPISTEEGVNLERARLVSIHGGSVVAMLNAEDHLTIGAICPKNSFREVFDGIRILDHSLDKVTPFASNRTFGFLSPNLDHCGTGILLSAHVKLIGLSITRKLDSVFRALEALGLTITPVYSRDSLIERIYAKRPLSGGPLETPASEKDAPPPDDDFGGIEAPGFIYRLDYDHEAAGPEAQLAHMEAVLAELERQEHKARCMLTNEPSSLLLHDYFIRAVTIGINAIQLSKSEAIDILSTAIMALQYGIFPAPKRALGKLESAFQEIVYTSTIYPKTPLDEQRHVPYARIIRADFMKETLSSLAQTIF